MKINPENLTTPQKITQINRQKSLEFINEFVHSITAVNFCWFLCVVYSMIL